MKTWKAEYLNHFTKSDDPLVKLISEYGFRKIGIKNNGEDIFAKNLMVSGDCAKSLPPIEISKAFYPSFYDGNRVKKFIVPILPTYHNKLFTDYSKRQVTLAEYADEFVIEGNTIKKAYLSHSNIKRMQQGDLILFYRSEDLQAITSLGVVEGVYSSVEDMDRFSRSPEREPSSPAEKSISGLKEALYLFSSSGITFI